MVRDWVICFRFIIYSEVLEIKKLILKTSLSCSSSFVLCFRFFSIFLCIMVLERVKVVRKRLLGMIRFVKGGLNFNHKILKPN